ncbi:MAG: hypothetical protein COS89_08065 [Deltaproteobacteria bacterium CG07_land_8_20_14_0_80_38_7]|nr:MAG: hypothetical protein COS89_08065 [Deltaproteobacteria bacterium CG07_land_8_20_14_0_80_38_7]
MKNILIVVILCGLISISQEGLARNVGVCTDPDIISDSEVEESMSTWNSWSELRGNIVAEGTGAIIYHFNGITDFGRNNSYACNNYQYVDVVRGREIEILPVFHNVDFRNNQGLALCNTLGLCTNKYKRFRARMSDHALGEPPNPFEVSPLQLICAVDQDHLTRQMPWANTNTKRFPVEGVSSSMPGGPVARILEGHVVRVYHNLDIGAGGPDIEYNYCEADLYEVEDTSDNGNNGMRLFRFIVNHPCRPTESCAAEATRAVQICHELATALVHEKPIYIDGTPIDICGRVKTRSIMLLSD